MSRQPYQFTNEEVPTSELMIGGGVIRFDPTDGIYRISERESPLL